MGVTDAHKYNLISPENGLIDGTPVPSNQNVILREFYNFFQDDGGKIDCQPYGCGRDAHKLRALSKQSGEKIDAATGMAIASLWAHIEGGPGFSTLKKK